MTRPADVERGVFQPPHGSVATVVWGGGGGVNEFVRR